MEVPAGFRQMQREAGIWFENRDSFFDKTEPHKGQENAYFAISEMVERKKRLLVLTGESRSGKSWLTSGYINYELKTAYGTESKETSKYMTFFEMELALRSAMTLGTMERLFLNLVAPTNLVIDELGRGKWSEFTATFFTNLILKRYGEGKNSLIATNLSGSELKEMLDFALLERLKEQNAVILVKK